jgi:hypothetical protein
MWYRKAEGRHACAAILWVAMVPPIAISFPLTVLIGVAVILILVIPVRAFGRWAQRKGRDIERGRRD